MGIDAEEEFSFDYPREEQQLYGTDASGNGFAIEGFDWDADRTIPGDFFTVYGSEVILSVLIRLCERCGQLYLYPDSGAPAIVLDASLEAGAVAELYAETYEMKDAWSYFFENMYGPGGLAVGEGGPTHEYAREQEILQPDVNRSILHLPSLFPPKRPYGKSLHSQGTRLARQSAEPL